MDLFIRSTSISHASQGSVPSSCLQSILPQLTGRMRISLQCRSRKNSPMKHWVRKKKKKKHKKPCAISTSTCTEKTTASKRPLLQAIRTPIRWGRKMLLGWPSCSHMLWWMWNGINRVSWKALLANLQGNTKSDITGLRSRSNFCTTGFRD